MQQKRNEEWRLVVGHPDYSVSSEGRVMRMSAGRGTRAMRVLSPSVGAMGYRVVAIGKRRFYVHRLVAAAFHGPCPEGHECLHRDGDRQNNRDTNLHWGTRAENCLDTVGHGRTTAGVRNPAAKLTPLLIGALRALRELGAPQPLLGRVFGLDQGHISRICARKLWGSVP